MLKIIGVETKKGCYISNFSDTSYSRYNSLNGYVINGSEPKPSHDSNWSLIDSKPIKIQENVRQPNINHRWELIDPSLKCKKTPLTVSTNDLYYDYEGEYFDGKYAMFHSMYERKSDPQPDKLVDVEFEYEKVCSIEEIKGGKNKYSTFGKIEHQLVDKIIHPSVILSEKECSYSVQTTYEIIRQYIKSNINPMVAEITSDYDFCFTVKKKIKLETPESYEVDVNNGLFQKRKRKPKFEARYRKSRHVSVFEMAPKQYQNYTVIEPFTGKNHKNLIKNVGKFLKEKIEMINEPLIDCPHCEGRGVIESDEVKNK